MNYYALSALINAVTSVVLGTFVYYNNKTSRVNRSYAAFNFFVTIWSIGYLMWQLASTQEQALYWCRVLIFGAAFIPIFFLQFVVRWLHKEEENRKILFVGYGIFGIAFFFNFTSLLVSGVQPRSLFAFWPVPGPAFHPFIFLWAAYAIYACILLIKAYRVERGPKRIQIRYILIGTLIGYVGGSTNYFLWYNIPVLPFGNAFASIYVAMTAYVILRHRFMDISIAISRAGISLGVYSLVFTIPFYIGYKTHSWVFSISSVILLVIPAPLIYHYFRTKAEDLLLAQQRHYQKILIQAASGMVREHTIGRLLKLIVYIVKRTVGITFTALFLYDKSDNTYKLKVIRDRRHTVREFSFSEDDPFIEYLRKKREPVLFGELPLDVRESVTLPLNVCLIIPSFAEAHFLSFLLLGKKHNQKPYDKDDINVFKILSHQAALAIENCLFFDEFKRAQEKVFTAEKLASIGGMADGVAHQVKNRLNHFSVASGELKFEISDFIQEHPQLMIDNPALVKTFDYLAHIADSFLDNVKRTDGIISGILNFARVEEKDTFFSRFSLKEIVSLSLDLLKLKHEIPEFPLQTHIPDDDSIYGVKAQIMETVYNILDNGYESIREKMNGIRGDEKAAFSPQLTLSLFQNDQYSRIEISDNGMGISLEDRHKIFAPFFTTKSSYKSGTGIGMYVVKRIVEENHHGRIRFESMPQEGTTFLIDLPGKKVKQNTST